MRTQKAIKNSLFNYLDKIVAIVVYFFCTPLILRYLGNENFAFIQFLLQTLGYLNLAELGASVILTVELYEPLSKASHEQVNKIASSYATFFKFVGLSVFLIGVLTSFGLPTFFPFNIDHQVYIVVFLIYVVTSSLTYFFCVPSIVLIASQQEFRIALPKLLTSPIVNVIGLVAAYHFSIIGWAISYLAINVVVQVLQYKMASRALPWLYLSSMRLDFSVLKKAKYVMIDKLLVLGVFRSDYLVLAFFGFSNQLSVYAIYVVLFNYLTSLIWMPLSNVTHGIGELWATNQGDRVQKLWMESVSILFIVSVFLVPCVLFCAQDFMKVWLGRDVEFPFINVMLLSTNLLYLITIHSTTVILNSKNLFKKRMFGSLLELFLNLLISCLLAPSMGVTGVIIGTLMGHFFGSFWYLLLVFSKTVDIKYSAVISTFLLNYFLILVLCLLIGLYGIPQFNKYFGKVSVLSLCLKCVTIVLFCGIFLMILKRIYRPVTLGFVKIISVAKTYLYT